MKVKNSLNANSFPKNYEKNNGISLTVPDQTMSIRTILERYSRGLPIGGRTDVYYDEEDEMPDIKSLDLSEIQEMRENAKQTIEKYSRKKVINNVDNTVENSERVEKIDETES